MLDFLTDPLGTIMSVFRDAINESFLVGMKFLSSLASGSAFGAEFNDLLRTDEITNILHSIWDSVTVPIGEVVVLVFFVIGLCNVFRTVGQSEAGIDIWQIFMCYFMLVAGILLIQNSWQIMQVIYTVSLSYMDTMQDIIGDHSLVVEASHVADGIDDWGQLFFLLLLGVVAEIGGGIIYVISYGTMALRAIQIYIYAFASPIPLAMIASESTRKDAGMFFKRFLAVILSGFIILALLGMMMVYLNSAGNLDFASSDNIVDTFTFASEYILGFLMPALFAWAMIKSGKWARDLLGIY